MAIGLPLGMIGAISQIFPESRMNVNLELVDTMCVFCQSGRNMNVIDKRRNHCSVEILASASISFRLLFMLIFVPLLPLCACATENPEADVKQEAVGGAINEEKSSLGSNEVVSFAPDVTMERADTSTPATKPKNEATARTAEKAPVLWIECWSNKEIQAQYDIMQENACKSTAWIWSYNQQISRVLYEYLQKNEPGKENRLVEHYYEWYSKTTEKLQQIEKDKRKEYLDEVSIEYIKPITEEIEGKFPNACAYVQYLFTHAKYMFAFFPSTQYR